MSAARPLLDPDGADLMFHALRHLEREMHRVAPPLLRHGLKDMPAAGVAEAADQFCAAIRACVREEIEHVLAGRGAR